MKESLSVTFVQLHAMVKEDLARGFPKELVESSLLKLFQHYQDVRDEGSMDAVGDVLDCLNGHCAPGAALL